MPYVSASQIKAFRRCPSFWWNGWVMGIKEPPSDAMKLGQEHSLHLEEYLTGARAFEDMMPLAQIGEAHLPDPSSDIPRLSVEHKIVFPSSVEDVDYVGYIDFVEHWPDKIRVRDHKTRARKKWALTEDELREDVQMNLYAYWVYKHSDWSPLDTITISHINYYKDRPFSDCVEIPWDRSVGERIFAECERDVEQMEALRHASDRKHIPGDTTRCNDFNRLCVHASYCPHRRRIPPMSVFGASTGTGTNPLAKLGLLKDKTVVEDEFEAGFSFEGLTPPDAPENTDPVVEKATENTPAETPVEDGFDLYIKCLPVGEPHSMIEAYLGEVLENATSVLGSDYRLVDYGKGYEQVQVFMERDIKGLSGAIVVMDPFSAVSKAVLPVLRRYARRVIAGL